MQTYYTGAYTSNSFVDFKLPKLKGQCYNYILKGYPGVLKQDVFHTVKDILESKGASCITLLGRFGQISKLFCESLGFAIIDGTYPYHHETTSYGVSDTTIDILKYQDTSRLREGREEVLTLSDKIKNDELRCCRFLSAAAGVNEDCKRIYKESLDVQKINRFTAREWAKTGAKLTGSIGVDIKIFAQAYDGNNTMDIASLFEEICDDVLTINDSTGAVSDIINDRFRRYAMSCGMDVISCMSVLNPHGVPKHIIIPDIRFGVYSKQGKSSIKGTKHIHSSRFLSDEMNELAKNRVSFSLKALESLLNEAAHSLEKVRFYENQLDNFYAEKIDIQKAKADILSKITELDF